MPWLLNGLYLLALVFLSPWLLWRVWKQQAFRAGLRDKFLGVL